MNIVFVRVTIVLIIKETKPSACVGEGQTGSALRGSLQILVVFDRGTFWVLPLTYLYLPKSARAYLFPQSVKIHYFCSGPTSAGPHLSATRFVPARGGVAWSFWDSDSDSGF